VPEKVKKIIDNFSQTLPRQITYRISNSAEQHMSRCKEAMSRSRRSSVVTIKEIFINYVQLVYLFRNV
jgi:hypothetical protein